METQQFSGRVPTLSPGLSPRDAVDFIQARVGVSDADLSAVEVVPANGPPVWRKIDPISGVALGSANGHLSLVDYTALFCAIRRKA